MSLLQAGITIPPLQEAVVLRVHDYVMFLESLVTSLAMQIETPDKIKKDRKRRYNAPG